MPRPKRWRALVITSFYFPIERQDTIDKLSELARRERISLSEILVNAATEYVELHYPGNPAVPLTAFTENGLKPTRLEAKMVYREAEKWLKILENPDCAEYLKKRIRTKDLPPLIVKLAKLNRRLGDEEVSELVDSGDRACFGEVYAYEIQNYTH